MLMKTLASTFVLLSLFVGNFSPAAYAEGTPVYYQRVCRDGKCRLLPIGTALYVAPDYYDYDPSAIHMPGSWIEAITGVF